MVGRSVKALSAPVKEQMKKFWIISQMKRKFSCMPIDQAHEQNNELVKEFGGGVGLAESFSLSQMDGGQS